MDESQSKVFLVLVRTQIVCFLLRCTVLGIQLNYLIYQRNFLVLELIFNILLYNSIYVYAKK